MSYSIKHLYAALFIFVCIFFCFRIPFYSQKLVAEEGIFAHLFLNGFEKPYYLLISRVDGKDIMGLSQHPGPMYLLTHAAGKVAGSVVDIAALDEPERNFAIRLFFSLPLLSLFLCALVYIHRRHNATFYYWYALLLCVVSSPALLVSSTELQLDNSLGVAIFGAWVMAVLAVTGDHRGSLGVRGGLLFVGSFIASLGKNEWSLILFLSMLLLAFVSLLRRGRPERREAHDMVLLCGFAGILLGNLFSYLYDPLNYVLGLKLLFRLSRDETVLAQSQLLQLVGATRIRWGYASQNVLLALTCSYLYLRSMVRTPVLDKAATVLLPLAGVWYLSLWSEYLPLDVASFSMALAVVLFSLRSTSAVADEQGGALPPDPVALLPVLFSGFLLAGYFLTTYEVGPRLFSISLVISLCAVLCLVRRYDHAAQRKLALNLTLCTLLLNGASYLNLDSYKRVTPSIPAWPSAGDCLPIMSSADGAFSGRDFLGGACDREYFQEMSRKYQKPLCGE